MNRRGDETTEPGRSARPAVRIALVAVGAAVVVAAAGAAATGAFGGAAEDSAAAPSGPSATAEVQRTTLTSSQTIDGQLEYGDLSTVQAPVSHAPGGIVTWMPADGDTIDRGQPVYKVDEQSVPLLFGTVPLYRTLEPGSTGNDVRMLEENLSALGYEGFTVDDEYTWKTAAAVETWQQALGRAETGVVKVGDAIVASGARRVADAHLAMGDPLAGAVLAWTGTERVISVDLPVQYAELATLGAETAVTLPDSTVVAATVSTIGTPTSSSGAGGQSSSAEPSGSSSAIVPIELAIADESALGAYQAAVVSVRFTSATHADVLAVPVSALFALPEGGYAVEVVSGSATELQPVELGVFGNGMVEVSGEGIAEGTIVGVPR